MCIVLGKIRKKREREREGEIKKRLGVCESIGERGDGFRQEAEEGREPGELCAILFRSFVARAPSLVWTISITTVLKFNDSENLMNCASINSRSLVSLLCFAPPEHGQFNPANQPGL